MHPVSILIQLFEKMLVRKYQSGNKIDKWYRDQEMLGIDQNFRIPQKLHNYFTQSCILSF